MTDKQLNRFTGSEAMGWQADESEQCYYDKGVFICDFVGWNPSSDPQDAFMLLQKCVEKCTDVHFIVYNEEPRFKMWGGGYKGIGESLELAIARFAFSLFGGGV